MRIYHTGARDQRAAGGSDEELTHWIATIQYAYADPPADPKTRRWNPLGFKIIDFKPEPEVLPEASPPAAALASSASSAVSTAPERTP